jgi:outer membrane murein-binding lipoprotein Lpp
MAFAIARIAKLKGGSVAGAGRHVDRTRETPNADRAKLDENRILIGDDRPVRELVTEKIDEHGGKPRCDSVECVELLLAASPEYFNEGREENNPERVHEFAEKTVEFLHEQYGDRCVKATLHLDEKTPHVQAFVVPVDERGKLNCKSFFGSRAKLRAFQDAFAEKMQPLGLERGVKGSRATHEDIQRFYGAINREVRVRVQPEKVPDPPRVMVTEASRRQYKQQVIHAVAEQFHEPVNILNKQAKLAREEKGKREAAEKRAAKAEQREKEWAEKFIAEQKENIAFHHQTRTLQSELATERQQKGELNKQIEQLSTRVQILAARVQDIPLITVMRAMGYRGEERGADALYRDAHGGVAIMILDNKVTHAGQVVAHNAVDLVIHMREAHQQIQTTPRDAITWLADTFGKERATAASLVYAEQRAGTIIGEHERNREVERQREIESGIERERHRQRAFVPQRTELMERPREDTYERGRGRGRSR